MLSLRQPPASSVRSAPRGVSLVSLMAGLALSLVCVLAALHAYRATVTNARQSSLAARAQSVSTSLALQLGKLLPQAGWGLGAAEAAPGGKVNIDMVLLEDAVVSAGRVTGTRIGISGSSHTGNALFWSTAIQGVTQCYGLVAGPSGLQLLGPQACADTSVGLQMAWARQTTLAPGEVFPELQLAVSVGPCWPFAGNAASSDAVQVQLQGTVRPMAAICAPNIRG